MKSKERKKGYVKRRERGSRTTARESRKKRERARGRERASLHMYHCTPWKASDLLRRFWTCRERNWISVKIFGENRKERGRGY